MQSTIRAANAAARKIFGNDIEFVVARAPAFGHVDCCVIVRGKNHAAAAASLASKARGAKVAEERATAWEGRKAYTYSTVTF